MLIRTQYKDALVNINNIDTIICNDVHQILAYRGRSSVILGGYSSKKKAHKVLDILQHRYLQYKVIVDSYNHLTFNDVPKVFEMPQDNEV